MEICVTAYLLLDSCIKIEVCCMYTPTEGEQVYYFENTDTTITNTIGWKQAKLELEQKMKTHCTEWEEPLPNPEH